MLQPEIRPVSGREIREWIPELAKLRIRVFRDYPYLYDGALEYEEHYLEQYAKSDNSLFVLALHGCGSDSREVVGVSTGIPLLEAESAFSDAIVAGGQEPSSFFYFGESVLDRKWRGFGVGKRFFDEREKFAKSLGFSVTAFCAVDRPSDHPRRPIDYLPLDGFWKKRGYERQPGVAATLAWKEVDGPDEINNTLTFWWRKWK